MLQTGKAVASVSRDRRQGFAYSPSSQDVDGRQAAKCVAHAVRRGVLVYLRYHRCWLLGRVRRWRHTFWSRSEKELEGVAKELLKVLGFHVRHRAGSRLPRAFRAVTVRPGRRAPRTRRRRIA
jgi:hypothetical protein